MDSDNLFAYHNDVDVQYRPLMSDANGCGNPAGTTNIHCNYHCGILISAVGTAALADQSKNLI